MRYLIFCCCILLPFIGRADDTYVLTDTYGKPIECKLIDYAKGHALIDMDGTRYSLPLSRFSKASSRAILDWASNRAIRNGELRIQISSRHRDSLRDENNHQIQHVHYTITLLNDSKLDLDGVEVAYKIYWLDGRVDIKDPFYFWIDASETIGRINMRARHQFETEKITLKERENRKDSAIGIWLKLYRNGQALHEEASPIGMSKQVEWRNMSLEAIY